MKRAIKYSISDDDADSLIQEAKAEYEKKIAEYSETLNRLRNEMSDLFSKFNYVCWMVNNDSHRFVYDRDTRQFSEIKYNRTVGRYTFEEFDRLVKERGMVSDFSPYEFKMEKE